MGREQPISGHVELGAHGIVPNYFEQNQVGALYQCGAPRWAVAPRALLSGMQLHSSGSRAVICS